MPCYRVTLFMAPVQTFAAHESHAVIPGAMSVYNLYIEKSAGFRALPASLSV